MTNSNAWSPADVWWQFRLEAEAAKKYYISYEMYTGMTHKDPLLEKMLPTLLFIKAVTLLDNSIELWLLLNGHILSKPYRDDLNGRIKYLADNNILNCAASLHDIRIRRNALAHEPKSACNWEDMDKTIVAIEDALVSLNLVKKTPKLEFFAERSETKQSQEPGVKYSRTFKYGVKDGQEAVFEISWTQKFLKD